MMLMSFPFAISHKQNNDKRIKVKSDVLRGSTKSSLFFAVLTIFLEVYGQGRNLASIFTRLCRL